jgi:glycosyltransferase involved in cell wall biosynthesis
MTLSTALVLGPSTGGIGAHVRDVAAGLVAHGYRVVVAGPTRTEEQFAFTQAGARFRPVEMSGSMDPRSNRAAVRALRSALAGVEVAHAHGVQAGALTGLALGRGRQTASVVTLHNAMLGTGFKALLRARLEGMAVRSADVVLGASGDLVDHARALGAREARLGPVPAPPLPAARRERAQVREELLGVRRAGDERILVLAIGRLAPQKDYGTLLQAARIWQRAWPRTGSAGPAPRLAIAGDGPLRAALQAEIGAGGPDAALLGHRADIADLLGAADILALSSSWEARALAVQEAMRTGVPVVATAVGGIPGLVGDAGVLVPRADAAALADAVLRLAVDPRERDRLRALGRERADSWPDSEQVLLQLLALYNALAPAQGSD